MTDIVERIDSRIKFGDSTPTLDELLVDARDEIERLRTALAAERGLREVREKFLTSAEAALAAETERCARICSSDAWKAEYMGQGVNHACAAAIRAAIKPYG